MGTPANLGTYCDDLTEKGTLKRLDILDEAVQGEAAVVRFKFRYESGGVDEGSDRLLRHNGIWEVELMQTGAGASKLQ